MMPRFVSKIALVLAFGVPLACGTESRPPAGGQPGSGGGPITGGSGGAGGAIGSGGSTGGDDASAGVDAPITGTDAAASNDSAPDGAAGNGGDVSGTGGAGMGDSVIWLVDNVQSIGGHAVTVSGAPQVIDTPAGKAVQFNGTDDALFVENHPLAGLAQFTVEVIFRPDAGGAAEQRFFHMQANGSENRVLFETRLPGNGMWFLDTYVMSNAGGAPLLAQNSPHPIGPWYAAALVIDGTQMRHYINGVQELAVGLKFQPHLPGRTSFGVRLTKAYWYKGAIRMARFTPRVLTPAEFLKAN
jgi:Concanavalin A-like lectin/glucanases superfamily